MKDPNDTYYNFDGVTDDLILQLLKLPLGYHYFILYPEVEAMRKIYSQYIYHMIEQRNVAILFLPYYDTTDKVRQELILRGLDVRKYERNYSLILLDFAKVVDNPYLGIPAAFGLNEFIKKIKTNIKNKNLFVIADMSIYHHFRKINDLLKYESQSHSDHENRSWKQLCFYHKVDFDLMFTDEEKQRILDSHKNKVIIV